MTNQPDEQQALTNAIAHEVDVLAAAIGGHSSIATDRAKAAIMDVMDSMHPLDLDQVVAKLNCLASNPKPSPRPRKKQWSSGQGFGAR